MENGPPKFFDSRPSPFDLSQSPSLMAYRMNIVPVESPVNTPKKSNSKFVPGFSCSGVWVWAISLNGDCMPSKEAERDKGKYKEASIVRILIALASRMECLFVR